MRFWVPIVRALVLVAMIVIAFGAGSSASFTTGIWLMQKKITTYCQTFNRFYGTDGKLYLCAEAPPQLPSTEEPGAEA